MSSRYSVDVRVVFHLSTSFYLWLWKWLNSGSGYKCPRSKPIILLAKKLVASVTCWLARPGVDDEPIDAMMQQLTTKSLSPSPAQQEVEVQDVSSPSKPFLYRRSGRALGQCVRDFESRTSGRRQHSATCVEILRPGKCARLTSIDDLQRAPSTRT